MGFLSDLKAGEELENRAVAAVEKAYGLRLHKNENKRGIDLICPIVSMEVKLDRRANETGNVFIELTSSKEPSGLFAYSENPPTLFAISDGEALAIFNTRKLKDDVLEWAADGRFRITNGGDGWRSRGILASWSVLKEEAIDVLTL